MKVSIKKLSIISYLLSYALLLGTTFYMSTMGVEDKFFRIILTGLTIFIVMIIFRATPLKSLEYTELSAIFFIFISMYIGNILNIYSCISNYDKILHVISGLLLAFVGLDVLKILLATNYKNTTILFKMFFMIIFAISCAGVWEIWEFSTDQLLGFNSQFASLHDTMWDIICGTTGGIISSLTFLLFNKNRIEK